MCICMHVCILLNKESVLIAQIRRETETKCSDGGKIGRKRDLFGDEAATRGTIVRTNGRRARIQKRDT